MLRLPVSRLLPALAWLALLLPCVAAAQTGAELYADGNRLSRERLWWAALLRYEEALEAGYDTPTLHYNRGVAHYRAGQYERAREAFLEAAAGPGFRTVAEYNLGLTAMAAGERDVALGHFRRVRDQEARPELAALASRAIERLSSIEDAAAGPDEPAWEAVVQPRGLALDVTLGVGSDDNVFRSPDRAYVDRASRGNPTVTPVVQSGAYVPLNLAATYSVGSFDHESFFGSYRLAGRYYQDQALENANEFVHQLAFGSTYHRRGPERERKIRSAFTIAQHVETWYDRDDGSERLLGAEPVGDRLSFTRYGPELWARQSFSRLSFTLNAKGQIWNYESSGGLPQYDHEYLRAGLSAQYRFTATSLIRIEGDAWTRRFGERPSFELDGTQLIDSPAVRYDYLNYGATARQRITRWFWFGLRYARTERTDGHVGYNDYLRDSYGAELSFQVSDRFKLRAEGWYRNYNYVRAFAFNDPAAGRKTLETADGRLSARWQMSQHFALVGSYEYADVASNDLRIDYTRGQFMLGIRWQH